MKSLTTAAIAVAGLGACAMLVSALDHEPTSRTVAAVPATTVTQGAIAVRDAESGTLRAATPREAARYAVSAKDKATAVAMRRADGSLTARLDDSHMIYTTVTRNADGEWEQACGMDHDHASHDTAEREVR